MLTLRDRVRSATPAGAATSDDAVGLEALRADRSSSGHGDATAVVDAPIRPSSTDAPTSESPTEAKPAWTGLMLAMVASATGVLVVSFAYAAGRDSRPWAAPAYWCGHLLMFAPLAAYVLIPKTRSKWAPVVALGFFQSLTQWMYSPLMFKFSDELQHRRTAIDILQHHSLFHANLALPVSPRFPGLEEITTSLMSLTGLNLFAAGQIVAGLAHVGVAVGIFVLLRRVTRDERLAAVAALIFAISPQNPFFNGMWVYETPALLFMIVALTAATRQRLVAAWMTAVICLAALSVTHHVTAAVTALTLLALGAAVTLQAGLRGRARQLLVLGAVGAMMIVTWVIFVAPMTYQYLSGPLSDVFSGFLRAGSVGGKAPVGGAGVSPVTTAATIVGTGTMGLLVTVGAVVAWRRSEDALTRSFAVFGLGFFGVIGIRLLAADGAELLGRLLTYEYLFACVAAAFALTHPWRRGSRLVTALGLAALVLVFVGNTTSGWPAPYEFVPGKFKVDAFESGVDPAGVQAARWAAANLPRHAKVACDFTSCSLLGGYGSQSANGGLPGIFYSRSFDQRTRSLLVEHGIAFVIVDRRIASQRPVDHAYFDNETAAQKATAPLPAWALEKFNRDPRVDRVYDAGPMAVYDVRRLSGA